jgi:hypothetical protein
MVKEKTNYRKSKSYKNKSKNSRTEFMVQATIYLKITTEETAE